MGWTGSRLLRMVLAALVCLSMAGAVSVEPVWAAPAGSLDNGQSGLRGFFRKLFRPEPRKRPKARPSPKRTIRSTRPRSQNAAPAAQPAAEPAVEKLENARKVLVVGDFMAGGLADGLKDAFADLPGVIVVDRSNGSSGFVRNDFYDWPGQIKAILEEEKPAVVAMMIGSNDRQQMQTDGGRLALRSEEWDAEYKKRVETFATELKNASVPYVWVGAPSFRSSSMTADMLAFNDFYKSIATANGGEFVDIWNGFVDENGNFIATGPDVNGQVVRLRSSDGINITGAGRRKIAFYAEKPLKKILGAAVDPNIGKLTPEMLPNLTLNPVTTQQKIDRTVPVSLTDPALDGGDELLGRVPEPAAATAPVGEPTVLQRLTIEGVAPAPEPGRADDFSRPAPASTPSAPAGG
ncbi:SGNH/GDSL hydrolase family protein [Zhengella mangrovi]|nr:DUF459 domain-containing protein [Zhengella mangrovi]